MMKWLKTILQYFVAIFCAVVVAVLIRLFVWDFYSIPSDSMEPAIEPGDFILVNKLYLGARFYKNLDFPADREPETCRIPGYSRVRNNDVLVFNFPDMKNRARLKMDVSTFYVKRCIGIPGDTLSIINGYYHINGKPGFGNMKDQKLLANYTGDYQPGIFHAFPFSPEFGWSIVDFGPMLIPCVGQTISLDRKNMWLYGRMVCYEQDTLARITREGVFIRDSLIMEYTFQKNWYFMGGDKIFNSRDSRYIGLIPESFLVGKASIVLTSKNPRTKKYNLRRFFKSIR